MSSLRIKICSQCSKSKPITEFNWKIRGVRYQSHCKECDKIKHLSFYKKNKLKVAASNRQRKLEIRQWIYRYLLSHPCEVCGESNPVLLEFAHRVGVIKRFSMCQACNRNVSDQTLSDEVAKCRVLCVRCHRLETAAEQQWYTGPDYVGLGP